MRTASRHGIPFSFLGPNYKGRWYFQRSAPKAWDREKNAVFSSHEDSVVEIASLNAGFTDDWQVPNPPGANPLVAERAP